MGKSATETFIEIMSGCNCGRRLYLGFTRPELIYVKISQTMPDTCGFSEDMLEDGRIDIKKTVADNIKRKHTRGKTDVIDVYASFLCQHEIENTSFAVAYRHAWFRIPSNQCIKWKKDNEECYINQNFILDKNKNKIMMIDTSRDNENMLVVSTKCVGSANIIHKTIVNNIVPAFINVYNGSVLFKDMNGETMDYLYRYSDNNTINSKLNNKLKYLSNISYF